MTIFNNNNIPTKISKQSPIDRDFDNAITQDIISGPENQKYIKKSHNIKNYFSKIKNYTMDNDGEILEEGITEIPYLDLSRSAYLNNVLEVPISSSHYLAKLTAQANSNRNEITGHHPRTIPISGKVVSIDQMRYNSDTDLKVRYRDMDTLEDVPSDLSPANKSKTISENKKTLYNSIIKTIDNLKKKKHQIHITNS